MEALWPTELRGPGRADDQPSAPVPGEGFEPPKASPADLQSAPFGRSGIPARVADATGFWRKNASRSDPPRKQARAGRAAPANQIR